MPDTDEPTFVRPAVHIAATQDLDPHWFGHPGSTVIYPLAGFYRAWDTLAHDGPLIGESTKLTSRFKDDPTGFYIVARLWTIALSVGAVPLIFLIGRRAFNTRVALVATAIWVALPIPVHYARIVRTDSAGLFFGMLALWVCLRLYDEPRLRSCVLAGLAVGLAVASRYFMLALVPVLLVAAVVPHRHDEPTAVRRGALALACVLGGFALSTPYFFLDRSAMLRTVRDENKPLLGHTGLSPLGNLRWYLGTAIPASLTWLLVGLAVAGILLALRRRRPQQLLLLLFGTTFLVGICASTLHWQRWLIQILPVLVMMTASTIDVVVQHLVKVARRVGPARLLQPVALVAVTAVLVIHPASELAAANRADSNRSTSGAALDWMHLHVPPGTRLLVDPYTLLTPETTRLNVDNRFSDSTGTLAAFRNDGYHYVVVDALRFGYFNRQPLRYPHQIALFRDLNCRTRLVAAFATSATRRGPAIRIYRVDLPPSRRVAEFCAAFGFSP